MSQANPHHNTIIAAKVAMETGSAEELVSENVTRDDIFAGGFWEEPVMQMVRQKDHLRGQEEVPPRSLPESVVRAVRLELRRRPIRPRRATALGDAINRLFEIREEADEMAANLIEELDRLVGDVDFETAEDCDLEPSVGIDTPEEDRSDDEPDLGATLDVDQVRAWEDSGGLADGEPMFGWNAAGAGYGRYGDGEASEAADELEEDDPAEDDGTAEYSLGALEHQAHQLLWAENGGLRDRGEKDDLELDTCDLEPTLGAVGQLDQSRWSAGAAVDGEGEPSLGALDSPSSQQDWAGGETDDGELEHDGREADTAAGEVVDDCDMRVACVTDCGGPCAPTSQAGIQ